MLHTDLDLYDDHTPPQPGDPAALVAWALEHGGPDYGHDLLDRIDTGITRLSAAEQAGVYADLILHTHGPDLTRALAERRRQRGDTPPPPEQPDPEPETPADPYQDPPDPRTVQTTGSEDTPPPRRRAKRGSGLNFPGDPT